MVLRVCALRKKSEKDLTNYIYQYIISLLHSSIAQSVEHAAVNRAVVGSSPTRGVLVLYYPIYSVNLMS